MKLPAFDDVLPLTDGGLGGGVVFGEVDLNQGLKLPHSSLKLMMFASGGRTLVKPITCTPACPFCSLEGLDFREALAGLKRASYVVALSKEERL